MRRREAREQRRTRGTASLRYAAGRTLRAQQAEERDREAVDPVAFSTVHGDHAVNSSGVTWK